MCIVSAPIAAAVPSTSLQFVVLNEVEFSAGGTQVVDDPEGEVTSISTVIAPIVCVRWLDNGEGLLVLTAAEVLVLKCPSLSVQERLPLSPGMSASLRLSLSQR